MTMELPSRCERTITPHVYHDFRYAGCGWSSLVGRTLQLQFHPEIQTRPSECGSRCPIQMTGAGRHPRRRSMGRNPRPRDAGPVLQRSHSQ
ncbi:hypothetical protein FKM82_020151 [Ascaphus truei]